MKILFVSFCLPYPKVAHGGGADLFHLIESLSQRHEIHLLSTADEREMPHAGEMRPFCRSVKVVIPALTLGAKLRNVWRALRTAPSSLIYLGRRARREMQTHIRRMVEEEGIEIVQFEWTGAGTLRGAVPAGKAATLLDEVDVSFRPLLQAFRRRPNPWALWKYMRTRGWELKLCRRFDAVLTRSESDRDALRAELPSARVEIFQPWTHVARFADISPEEKEKGNILFVGAMDRDENCEAVLHFYRLAFPHIRAAMPQVKLWVVGAAPQKRILALAGDPAVFVTGYVPDLRPYYARAEVCIAPMLLGGGVMNKVIDAMGAGRPVVSTEAGNEGVGARPDEEILLADDPHDFARKTLALLQDEKLWSKIASGGRRLAQETYDWERNVAQLEELYRTLI